MGTELNMLKGRRESIDRTKREVVYKSAEMNITSFSGGESLGAMIQLSMDSDHIQLTRSDVKQLINTLIDWL